MQRSDKNRSQRGFSLLEMLLVVAILMLVMGVTMRAIIDVQKRQRTEEAKVDLNQEGRDFVDQIVRDLHQSGYPSASMYTSTALSPVAAGLVSATQTALQFEGDMDGNGAVETVNYQLITDTSVAPAGQCPCILQRSMVNKGNPASYSTEVDQVINSTGTGNAPWTIAGNFVPAGATTASGVNDTYYASYKTQPVFRFYNTVGHELTPVNGTTFTENPGAGTCASAGCSSKLTDVRSVRITVNTMSKQVDPITGTYAAISMTASARVANQ
jgi:prepilin-type N-terminal cleavage/methylation domain-containing protein